MKNSNTKRNNKNNDVIKIVVDEKSKTRKKKSKPYKFVQSLPKTNPVSYRSFKGQPLLKELQKYQNETKNQYMIGLIHPDMAVTQGLQVKAYSDLPIPTSTVGYHIQSFNTTNSAGCFLLSWRPQLLLVAGNPETSNITFNSSASLTGAAASPGNNFLYGNNVCPPWGFGMQRYRLVSAMLKVSYNGPVLQQAGTMLSCATMDPFVVGNTSNATSVADTLVDRFGNYSIIQNGLWNNTVSITADSSGLECLYVPTDPLDLVFEQNGSFLGSQLSATAGGITAPGRTGAPINYVVAGRNLPGTSQCIQIDVYYNFEVVADPSSVPFVRPNINTSLSKQNSVDVHNAIKEQVGRGLMIRKSKPNVNYNEVLDHVVRLGSKYLPKLLALM